MENWWNAPLWWRERQFHSFLLIKYNLSRQKQEKYYERYLKGMLPITIEGQYYDLGCFCFISCPCTIPVNAIDKAIGRFLRAWTCWRRHRTLIAWCGGIYRCGLWVSSNGRSLKEVIYPADCKQLLRCWRYSSIFKFQKYSKQATWILTTSSDNAFPVLILTADS